MSGDFADTKSGSPIPAGEMRRGKKRAIRGIQRLYFLRPGVRGIFWPPVAFVRHFLTYCARLAIGLVGHMVVLRYL